MSANLKETLNTYSLSELKKMVSAYNKKVKIGPYTKLKKSDLINLMTSDKHRAAFSSVKSKSEAKAEAPKKKVPFKKTGRSGTEVMAEKKAEPKKVKVVRKTKGSKVTGGSVDGKDIASN